MNIIKLVRFLKRKRNLVNRLTALTYATTCPGRPNPPGANIAATLEYLKFRYCVDPEDVTRAGIVWFCLLAEQLDKVKGHATIAILDDGVVVHQFDEGPIFSREN